MTHQEQGRLTSSFQDCTETFPLQPQPIYNQPVLQTTHTWSWPKRSPGPNQNGISERSCLALLSAYHHAGRRGGVSAALSGNPFLFSFLLQGQLGKLRLKRIAPEMKQGKRADLEHRHPKHQSFMNPKLPGIPLILKFGGEIENRSSFLLEMHWLFVLLWWHWRWWVLWIWKRRDQKVGVLPVRRAPTPL